MKFLSLLTTFAGLAAATPMAGGSEEAGVEKRVITQGRLYYIRSVLDPNLVIDLAASDPEGGLLAYNFHGGSNQKWRVERFGNTIALESVATDTFAQSSGTSGSQLTGSYEYPGNNPDEQWILDERGNDVVVIRSAANRNLVVDVEFGKPVSGARIITYKYHGGKNQLWRFERAPSEQ